MIIIGSTAIKYWYLDFPREPKDYDIIVKDGEIFPFIKEGLKVEQLKNPILENIQQSTHSIRTSCNVIDYGNGTYGFNAILYEQGRHDLRIWHAFPGGLRGDYYYDAFFEKLALSRIDKQIHYEWGTGRLIPRGSDYISIRWTGLLLPSDTGLYWFYLRADDHVRMWIDGKLIIDHIYSYI